MEIVGENLYNHKFYLQMPKEDNNLDDEPLKKKFCYSSEKDDYLYTIPSARTTSDYKQIQASQGESNAALALLYKNPDVRCTLHYETTSRNSIDGE